VIAAVSGGADSVCLLHLLVAARERLVLTVETAHFNHRLRGRESDRDAAFVEELARRLALPFHPGAARAFTAAERRSASLQELARDQRLGFLLGLARRRRGVVALGHQADDQAETLVMRFLAGAGPAGLAGIPPASHGGALVHPLLGFRRADIERWLGERGIPFRTDRTNRSTRYLRNRVRLRLLPELAREFNPRLVERLGTLAGQARRDHELLEELSGRLLAQAVATPRSVLFPPPLLAAAHPALLSRAVLATLRRFAPAGAEFSSRHVAALLADAPGSRRWDLPRGVRAERGPGGLLVTVAPLRRPAAAAETPLPIPGRVQLPGAGGWIAARTRRCAKGAGPGKLAGDPREAALDLATVRPPLVVRGRRPGDRFQPFGMTGGKKLKEFLIDAKVPAPERDGVPLVCDRDGIVWVAGMRPSERCRVTERTRDLLCLSWVPGGPAAG
jgi:tRNA(Ile)-lysidine synthase